MSMLPVLAGVACCVSRVNVRVAALPHVTDLISSYVDDSPCVSLVRAAASGSLRLFDRVAHRIQHDPAIHAALRDHWFASALESAIQTNDLAMVQRVHVRHPEALVVQSLRLAFQFGSLELVQWVVENRHDQLCCRAGIENLCAACLDAALFHLREQDAFRVVRWLVDAGALVIAGESGPIPLPLVHRPSLIQALLQSSALIPWLDVSGGYLDGSVAKRLLCDSLDLWNAQTPAVVAYLVDKCPLQPSAARHPSRTASDWFLKALIQSSCRSNAEPVVRALIESHLCEPFRDKLAYAPRRPGAAPVLQWERRYLTRTAVFPNNPLVSLVHRAVFRSCHFETMRWLVEDCEVTQIAFPRWNLPEEAVLLEVFEWLHERGVGTSPEGAAEAAASVGYLGALEWLRSHYGDGVLEHAVETAAVRGQLRALQWLFTTSVGTLSRAAAANAASKGQLPVLQWLCDHGVEMDCSLMVQAAFSGHVDVFLWLHDHTVNVCTQCVRQRILVHPPTFGATPVLNALWWLDEHATPAVGCTGECAGSLAVVPTGNITTFAAAEGDMELLEFLHAHHSSLFEWNRDRHRCVEQTIVSRHHIVPVQWLYARYRDVFDWHSVSDAAAAPLVAEWLDEQLHNPVER